MSKESFKYLNVAKPIFLSGICLSAMSFQTIAAPKMNVVFLLADDLRWNSLGCMGNKVVITPNIDQLAENGIRFNNACVTTAICMVSRASILSGQYMSRHQVRKFGVELPDKTLQETYPAVLRKAGY